MPTTSTTTAATPKMRSVRCRRRACTTVSGGLNSATSTASAATRVKAARRCRKAIAADAYISSWRGGGGSGGGGFACRARGAAEGGAAGGRCAGAPRGGPLLALPLARLARPAAAALGRHLGLPDQARLQQERLGDDDPLRVADATHGHVEGFHRDNNVIPMSRKVSTRPAGPPHPQLTPPSSASRAIAWWSARGACDRAGARAPPAEAGSACAAWGRRGRGG